MLADLPTELLWATAACLESERDINALARTSRHLFSLLDSTLYRYSVERANSFALFWAVEHGRAVTARKALEAGAIGDGFDPTGMRFWTPLSKAATYGHVDIVKLLLGSGLAHANAGPYGFGSPMYLAAEGDHLEVVRELLKVDEIAVDGLDMSSTPLMIAVNKGHANVVELLMESGKADLNARDTSGRTSVSLAAIRGNTSLVRMLIRSSRADADCKDGKGMSPLALAVYFGHADTVELLLASGVDADSEDRYGYTPLIEAAKADEGRRSSEVMRLLLDSGRVDTDHKDREGRTPLAWAAVKGNDEGVRLLLASGTVDPSSRDDLGLTPLHHAASVYHATSDDLLVERGPVDVANTGSIVEQLLLSVKNCDVGARDNDGRTPLWHAAENNWLAIGERLVEARGSKDTYVLDNQGLGPLDAAVRDGYEDFVRLLQRDGKATDLKDRDGLGPLDLAVRDGHGDPVKLLQRGIDRMADQVAAAVNDKIGDPKWRW